jgi:hypothetical protein
MAQLWLGNPEIERSVMQMLDLNYPDLVFDCHETDRLDAIKDNSLDERELQCCNSFPLGPLAPYRTWSVDESRTGRRSHIFFVARYFQQTSPSVAAFPLLRNFFTLTLTRR